MLTSASLSSAKHSPSDRELIEAAIARGAQKYFTACRARLPIFIQQHFGFPGALRTNRAAFGWDLLRAPLNLMWAPFYALVCLAKFFALRSAHSHPVFKWLNKMPAGLTTQVQRDISILLERDLLALNNAKCSLEQCIVQALKDTIQDQGIRLEQYENANSDLQTIVREALAQYRVTRTATADISNSLSCVLLGAFAFKKFTPGGIGIAMVLASMWAQERAIRHFMFGALPGKIYYTWFPPEPSYALIALFTGAIMLIMASIAALAGFIADPVQALTGIHARRLRNMLNHIERDFSSQNIGGYRPKEQFVARMMDLFDILKSSLQ